MDFLTEEEVSEQEESDFDCDPIGPHIEIKDEVDEWLNAEITKLMIEQKVKRKVDAIVMICRNIMQETKEEIKKKKLKTTDDTQHEETSSVASNDTNHVTMKADRELIFNEWILESYDVNDEYAKEIGNPYSRRFDEYKRVFKKEIEHLSNEYILRIAYEKDEIWKNSDEGTDYEPPCVNVQTFEVKNINSRKDEASYALLTERMIRYLWEE
ncbi:hypothetical protein Tco_1344154 [Tanacetum coccineum]